MLTLAGNPLASLNPWANILSSYLATETGTVRKKWKGRIPVALLYPNTYSIAVSNLGFQLVYSLLNQQDSSGLRAICLSR